MSIVLVHGGWQGGWVWDAVADDLRSRGSDVLAPTLRGLEEGDVDRRGVTASDLAEDLLRHIVRADLDDVVLVGHSGGGPLIQLVADRRPDLVSRVVFVDAWVLRDGECVNDVLPAELVEACRALAEASTDQTVSLPAEMWGSTFMQDADPETLATLVTRAVPTPVGWFDQALPLSRFWTLELPASYVRLRDDRCVPRDVFASMVDRLHAPRVVECAGSHEAMLTRPKELAEALEAAVA